MAPQMRTSTGQERRHRAYPCEGSKSWNTDLSGRNWRMSQLQVLCESGASSWLETVGGLRVRGNERVRVGMGVQGGPFTYLVPGRRGHTCPEVVQNRQVHPEECPAPTYCRRGSYYQSRQWLHLKSKPATRAFKCGGRAVGRLDPHSTPTHSTGDQI